MDSVLSPAAASRSPTAVVDARPSRRTRELRQCVEPPAVFLLVPAAPGLFETYDSGEELGTTAAGPSAVGRMRTLMRSTLPGHLLGGLRWYRVAVIDLGGTQRTHVPAVDLVVPVRHGFVRHPHTVRVRLEEPVEANAVLTISGSSFTTAFTLTTGTPTAGHPGLPSPPTVDNDTVTITFAQGRRPSQASGCLRRQLLPERPPPAGLVDGGHEGRGHRRSRLHRRQPLPAAAGRDGRRRGRRARRPLHRVRRQPRRRRRRRSSRATSSTRTCSTRCCPGADVGRAPRRPAVGAALARRPVASHHANATGTLAGARGRAPPRRAARGRGVVVVGLRRQPRRCPSTRTSRRCRCRPTRCRSWPPRPTRSPTPRCFGLGALAFRFFNVFGPLQAAGHAYAAVVPAFVAAALAGEPVTVHGDGEQTRDFTYVGSVCEVITDAPCATGSPATGPVNLAFGGRSSLLELLAELEAILGAPDRARARRARGRRRARQPGRPDEPARAVPGDRAGRARRRAAPHGRVVPRRGP